MKILIILTGGLKNDGISLGTLGYFKAMDKNDISVDFIAVNDVEPQIINKINDLGFNVIKVKNRKKNPILYCLKLFKIIKNNKYDIVHSHGSSSLILLEMIVSKFAGVPVRIAHSRNTKCDHPKIDKILRPLFYKVTTDFFACGEEAGKWLFKDNKFTVIPNGKNIESFIFNNDKRLEIRNNYGIGNRFAICHIGSFNIQKNHDFLIDIFYEFKKINSNSCLVLIGDGELRENIENKIKELGLIDDVIMTGIINNTNEVLQGMDYMILPSLFEGLPNVVIEAQIAGVQSIISNRITKECKITDLVEFESLETESRIWAERISRTKFIDREKCKEEIITMVRKAGYDIVENAKFLKNLYFELYNKNKKI